MLRILIIYSQVEQKDKALNLFRRFQNNFSIATVDHFGRDSYLKTPEFDIRSAGLSENLKGYKPDIIYICIEDYYNEELMEKYHLYFPKSLIKTYNN